MDTLGEAYGVQALETGTTSYTPSVTLNPTGSAWGMLAVAVQTNAPLAVTILPSPAQVDVGQTVTFTATATGGSGSYATYAWSQSNGAQLNCGIVNAPSITCTPLTTGLPLGTVSVTVTDSNGVVSPSASSVVNVYGDLAAPTFSVTSSVTMDVGQTLTIVATGHGGTSSYSYLWGETGCSGTLGGTSTATLTYAPDAATTCSLTVRVTDSGTTDATPTQTILGSAPTVTVDSTPTVSIAPTSVTMDQGQVLTITATPSGGTGSFSYSWTIVSGSCPGFSSPTSTGSTPHVAYTPSGTTTNCVLTVTMSDTGTLPFTNPPLNPTPLTATPATPTTILVNAALSVAMTPSTPQSMDWNQHITIGTVVSGGTGPFTYSWAIAGGDTCPAFTSPGSVASFIYTPTGPSSYPVTCAFTVTVTDTGTGTPPPGPSASLSPSSPTVGGTTAAITVYNDPSVTVPTPSPVSVDLGQTITFTTVASGGTTFYTTFTWSESTSQLGCILTNSAAISCTPTLAGPYHVQVTVTDTNGYTSTAAVSGLITVNSAFSAQTASPTAATVMDQGQTLAISTPATGYGGTGTYSFAWAVTGGYSCPGFIAPPMPAPSAYTFTYSPSGTSTSPGCEFTVTVTDTGANGPPTATPAQIVTETTHVITVDTTLTAQTATPSSATVMDQGQTLAISTPLTGYGGTGSYSFSWAIKGGASCPTAQTFPILTASFTYTPNGVTTTCQFTVTITDTGVSPSASPSPNTVPETTAVITVDTTLTAGAVTPGSPAIDYGQTITLTAHPSGGTIPYGYQWYRSLSNGGACDAGTALGTSSTLTVAGLYWYYYCYVATDASMGTPAAASSAWDLVTVNTPPSITTALVTPVSMDVAQTYMYTVAATGGTGTLVYTWTLPGQVSISSGCTTSDTSCTITAMTATAPASVTVTVLVTDQSVGVGDVYPTSSSSLMVIANSAIYSEVTATPANTQPYALPGAEEFTIGASNLMVDSIEVYLSGSGGSANVGIGSIAPVGNVLGGDNVLTAQTISPVSGPGWYTVYFPAVMLSGSTNYYLNVFGTSDVTWGFTSNPSSEVNAVQDYYYVGGYPGGVLTHDNATPNLYQIGVYFTQAYTVTFSQSGLSSGSWSATLGPTTLSAAYSSTIVFTVPNGAYPFTIPTVLGFSAAPSSGSITVNGAPMTQAIAYTPVPTYAVTFSQTGLGSGSWSVTLGVSTLSAAVGSHIVFNVPDGTYSFQVIAVLGFAASPPSGVVSVSGGPPATQAIAFSPVTPSFTVNPSSGPAGSTFVMAGSGYAGLTSYQTSFSDVTLLAAISCTVGTALAGSFTTTYLGTFSCTIQVPLSGAGSAPALYTVTGGVGVLATQPFTVTAPTPTEYSYVTATGPNTQYYALPGAEEFTAGGSTVTANYASVWLTGTGYVTVAIGTTTFGNDVVSPISVHVTGPGVYTVTFSAVLVANVHYYLNVQQVSGSVLWAYTVSPATSLNELQDYYYVSDVLTQDNASPNLYVVGYESID